MSKRNRELNKARREADHSAAQIEKWLHEQGAVESRTFDEETGRPMRTFTIDLTKEK